MTERLNTQMSRFERGYPSGEFYAALGKGPRQRETVDKFMFKLDVAHSLVKRKNQHLLDEQGNSMGERLILTWEEVYGPVIVNKRVFIDAASDGSVMVSGNKVFAKVDGQSGTEDRVKVLEKALREAVRHPLKKKRFTLSPAAEFDPWD